MLAETVVSNKIPSPCITKNSLMKALEQRPVKYVAIGIQYSLLCTTGHQVKSWHEHIDSVAPCIFPYRIEQGHGLG